MLQLDRKTVTRDVTHAQLEAGGGTIVEIAGDTPWQEAATQISGAVQVDIRFPSFKDGRGFSLATLLLGVLSNILVSAVAAGSSR